MFPILKSGNKNYEKLVQAWILAPDIGETCSKKIKLRPTKAASQRAQFSGVKLKKKL